MTLDEERGAVWKSLLATALFCLLVGILIGAWAEHVRLDRLNEITAKENLAGLIWVDCAVFKFDENVSVVTREKAESCARVVADFLAEHENLSVNITVTT